MFSIIDLIGRNALAVERIAGVADDSALIQSKNSRLYIKSHYREGGIEITYIDHIADQVLIYGKESSLIKEFICFLGLRFTPTNIKHVGVVKYYNIAGLAEVAFYGDREGKIDKLHIKAFTT